MLVIVDTNEQSTNPRVVDNLKKYFSSQVVIANISSDVQIPLDDGSILAIERKSPSDFLASIGDGRLKEQIECMFATAKYVAIVITGKFHYGSELVQIEDNHGNKQLTNWKSVSVRGMFRAIQMSGCILEFCPSSLYAQIVDEIYQTCNSNDHRQGLQKHRIVTFPPIDDRVQLLGQLNGVGIESAESLLQFAGTMDNNADEDGFGTVASALHWLTIMAHIDTNSRPKHWTGKRGALKILSNRKLLGLDSDEYIAVMKEKDNESM